MNNLFASTKLKPSSELLKPLFYISYWLAKENTAIIKYESLKKLLKLLEVEQVESYNSRHFCSEFLECIYKVMFESLLDCLKKS